MDPAHRVEVGAVDQVHAGADDVGEGGTGRVEGVADDLEAPPGLDLGVGVDAVVGPLRGRAGDEDPLRDAHRAAVADDELPRSTRRDELPVRHGEERTAPAQRAAERVAGRRRVSYGAAGGGPLASVFPRSGQGEAPWSNDPGSAPSSRSRR